MLGQAPSRADGSRTHPGCRERFPAGMRCGCGNPSRLLLALEVPPPLCLCCFPGASSCGEKGVGGG